MIMMGEGSSPIHARSSLSNIAIAARVDKLCMRRILSSFLPFVVVLLCLFAGIAACGGEHRSSSPPSPPSPSSLAEHRTTLILWHAWSSPDQHVLANLVDHFNQTHPTIQIVLQAMPIASLTDDLRAAAMAGSGPHLVVLQNHVIGDLARDELLLPLDSFFSSIEQDLLLPTAVNGAIAYGGSDDALHLYGIPFTFNTLGLFYHKQHIHIPPPDIETLSHLAHMLVGPTTTPAISHTPAEGMQDNEQREQREQHSQSGEDNQQRAPNLVRTWGFAYTLSFDRTIGYLSAFGGAIFDPYGSLILGEEGRDGTERWLEWLASMNRDPHILAVKDSITVDGMLKAHRTWMTIDWAHTLPTYRTLWGEQLGVAKLPRVAATQRAPKPYVQSNVVSINARVVAGEERRAALSFVRYLMSEHAQYTLLEAGKQPTLLDLPLEGDTPLREAARIFRSQAQEGQPMPNTRIVNEVVREEIERMQMTVLRGLMSPTDAVSHTETTLRERLQAHPRP